MHHNAALQLDYNLYGADNFNYFIFDSNVTVENMRDKEQEMIDSVDSSNPDKGYNVLKAKKTIDKSRPRRVLNEKEDNGEVVIIRKIDSLGRFVIPKEICKQLDIKTNDALSIDVNENNQIIIEVRKINEAKQSCT